MGAGPIASSYCLMAPSHPVHGPYHDNEYGFPLAGDAALLERLALEINQAGLSWLLVLKRRAEFRRAFQGFEPDRLRRYGAREVRRLLGDPGVIRNRKKIEAVIENARRVVALRGSHGSFAAWLDANHPLALADWVKLFRATFVFTGPEVVREFLVSVGYLAGAHDESCPVFGRIARLGPPWMRI